MKTRTALRSAIAAAVVAGTVAAQTTTTFIGPNLTSSDTWNNTNYWDNGVPTGAMNAVVPTGRLATAWSSNTPTYSGTLTIGTGAQVAIGWTTVYLQSYRALGTPGVTTIFMDDASFINVRMGGTTNIPAIQLRGNGTFCLSSSTQPNASLTFYGIHGPYSFMLQGKSGCYAYLTTSNSFGELIADAQFGNRWDIYANAAGSLGGHVTIRGNPGGFTPAANLIVNAADAIVDTARLSLSGTRGTLLTMNQSDTIGSLFLNGVRQLAGTYGRIGSAAEYPVRWIAGNGLLTVGGPTPVYWDLNGTTAGAGGSTPAGTWDAANPNWNAVADGTGSTAAWPPGQTAVFAAGTDANGTYTVSVSGTHDIGGLNFEEGNVALSGGGLRLRTDALVWVAGGSTATLVSPLSDDGTAWRLSKGGSGTLILGGTNTFSGEVALGDGLLSLASLTHAGSAGPLGQYPAAGPSGLILAGGTLRYTGGSTAVNRGFMIVADSTIDVATPGASVALGACASSNLAATLTVTGREGSSLALGTVRLVEGVGLTLNPVSVPLTVANVIGYSSYPYVSVLNLSGRTSGNVITGALTRINPPGSTFTMPLNITKSDSGVWTLAGTLNAASSFAVYHGTLRFSGQDSTSEGTTLAGGTLILDYTSNPNRKLGNNKALGFSGGTLVLHDGAFTEVASATTVNPGAASLTRSGTSTGKINLKAFTRNAGGTIDFADSSIADTTTANVNGILGGWATVAGTNWAVGGTPITALSSYTGPLPQSGGASADNDLLTGSQTQTGATLANTLRIAGSGSGDTLNLAGYNLTITYASASSLGGILYVGGGDHWYTLTGTGGKILTSSTTGELIINTATGTLTVAVPIVTDGVTAGVLTKTGPGTLFVNVSNRFTGAVYVNQGVLRLGYTNAAGTVAGGIQVRRDAALELTNDITIGAEALTLIGSGVSEGGALRNLAGSRSVYGGQITLADGGARIHSDRGGTLRLNNALAITNPVGCVATIGGEGEVIVSGRIAGSGNLVKEGTGTLTLSGTNTGFWGATYVEGGTLALSGSEDKLSDSAALWVARGAKVDLASGVNETVGCLYLNGTPMAAGTWGSTASSATYRNDTYFSGTGILTVLGVGPDTGTPTLPPPPKATVFLVR